ncbi:GAF domain-containing sensor histidine kinase [Marinifilum sp. D737]|jgi:signal transduction histidine kinase|uniref:GAF domain-containing sensor histidine kinase n=1 Tax=Marinifilum sp. D737 TaxID=2969628 RepID=UPI002273B6DF|nr:GAF domain-containing sensor histidine kinase [Marinifilum sp. D737]MCY1634143.1 GAF domain-containing sensor histidine kinase [Marinifilum sp. D737]
MKIPEQMPQWMLDKWQGIADLLAETLTIPAALIMRAANQQMEVFITSNSDNNPYHVGDKEDWHGLYCETVIKSKEKLLVANALTDKDWDRNPDIELGMVAYLGYPIFYPNKSPFGTICILDNKENHFSVLHEKILLQFKQVIELDLALVTSFEFQSSEMIQTIKEQQDKLKKQNKALQIAKEKAEEGSRLKSAFLQNISHEIRTPLNAVVGFSELLTMPDLTNEKRDYFASIIQKNSDQLLSIISDILTISAIETDQQKVNIEDTCLDSLLQDLEDIYRQKYDGKGIELIKKIPESLRGRKIKTDKTKVNQIITNLLNNAFKFTDNGSIEFGVELKNDVCEFYVKDSGIGIPENMQNEIFNRFTQTNETISDLYGGVGLGLSISKAFVELLGGEIWLKSEVGRGTNFYFTLPNQ